MSDDLSDLALAEALRRAWFGPDEDFVSEPKVGGRWYKVAREARARLPRNDGEAEALMQAIENEATQAIAAEAEVARQLEEQLRAAVNVLNDLIEHYDAGKDWKGGITELSLWFRILTHKIARARRYVGLIGDVGGDG